MAEKKEGIWLLDTDSLAVSIIGAPRLTKPSLKERIAIAAIYMKSKGKGPRFIRWSKRLAKGIAFCLKPTQVHGSGKPILTTGRSIEEQWANFKVTSCDLPHSGHGKTDNLEAKLFN